MLVTAHNQFGFTCKRTGEKFIVIRIVTNTFRKRGRGKDYSFCILAAAGFVLGAAGIFFSQPWWRTVVIATTAFSIILYILFWNGQLQQLDSQGGVGILIDAAILAAIILFRWPKFDF